MKVLCVTLKVDPGAAVRAGKTVVGDVMLTLSDADLAKLTEAQRDALAMHVDAEFHWRDPLYLGAPPIAEATVESLAALLDARIAREAERAAEKAQQLAEDEEKAKAIIEEWKKRPIEDFLDSYGVALTGRHVWYPPSQPRHDWNLADLTGRREELDALLAKRKAERDATEALRRQQAEADAKKVEELVRAERAQVRKFIETLDAALNKTPDPLVLDWFDSLDDPSQAKRYLRETLGKLAHHSQIDVYKLDKDTRVGEPVEPIVDLGKFRRKKELEAIVRAMLAGFTCEWSVDNVHFYRPATDTDNEDDVDEDGEVRVDGMFRIKVTVGSVSVSIWTV